MHAQREGAHVCARACTKREMKRERKKEGGCTKVKEEREGGGVCTCVCIYIYVHKEKDKEREKKRGGTCESKRGESGAAVVPFHLGVFFVGIKVHDGASNPSPVTRQHVALGKCPSRGGVWVIVEPCRFATCFILLRKRSSLHHVYTGKERCHTKKRYKDPSERTFGSFPRP
jgi:hypothetical protein